MATDKNSFLLYCDIIYTIKKLSNEKAGILFKHILSYVNDENPETDDEIIELVFEPIKQSLKRDLRRYEGLCQRNMVNGAKGGRPVKSTDANIPKKPTGLINNPNNPSEPKKADSDSDSDSVIDIDIDIDIKKIKDKKIKYAEFVNMLESEYEKLYLEFGQDTFKLIEILNNYKGANGKKYKSDYLAIRNWVIDRFKSGNLQQKQQKGTSVITALNMFKQ